MAKKQIVWKTKGMNRDLSVSAFNPEFAFENINLRLSTNDNNTTLSWVNEKGTGGIAISKITYYSQSPEGWREGEYTGDNAKIFGSPVGTAVLNNILVIFTHDNSSKVDYIYKFQYVNEEKTRVEGEIIYNGGLKFSLDHPLETLVSYESEDILKVYWTDGINQPRVINIANKDIYKCLSTAFDFIPTLQLNEEVKVKKILGGGGMFAPGVIQYAFTYYNKYGQESNIFYTTPLYYISYVDRGASPEDKVDNTFKITVEHVDTNFDYLRIYSIQRTSINGTPICKRIQDIDISSIGWEDDTDHSKGKKPTSYIDTGYNGNAIDPTELLYKGGSSIRVGTMEQKDGTLFMGDITTPQNEQPDINPDDITIEEDIRIFYPKVVSSNNYEYANQLSSYKDKDETESVPCAGFKAGNIYRCGVQFQDETGKWSDPVFIGDKDIKGKPETTTTMKPDEEGKSDITVSVEITNHAGATPKKATEYTLVKIRNQAIFKIDGKDVPVIFEGKSVIVIPGIPEGNTVTLTGKVKNGSKYPNGRVTDILLTDVNYNTNTIKLSDIETPNLKEGAKYKCTIVSAPEPEPEPEPGGESVATKVTIFNNSEEDITFSGKICFIVYGTYENYTGHLRLKGICSGNDFYIPRGESKLYKAVFTDDSEQSPTGCVGMRFAASSERGQYDSNNAYYIGVSGYTCVDFDSTGTKTFENNGTYTMTVPPDTHEWTDSPTPTPTPGDNPIITIGVNITNNTGSSVTLDGDMAFVMGNPDHNGNYMGHWSDGSVYKLPYNRTGHLYFSSSPVTLTAGQTMSFPNSLRWDEEDDYDHTHHGMGEKSPATPAQYSPGRKRNVMVYVDGNSETVLCNDLDTSIIFRDGQTYDIVLSSYSPSLRTLSKSIQDTDTQQKSSVESITVTVPVLKGYINSGAISALAEKYVKVRPVVVYPEMQDRKVVCQGVTCPTMYTNNHRGNGFEPTKDLYAQSSWFFRPYYDKEPDYHEDVNCPSYESDSEIRYMERSGTWADPSEIKRTEIQGYYQPSNRFKVSWNTLTFHSPDTEFDDRMLNMDYSASSLSTWIVGHADFLRTISDIDIQTSTPTISQQGSGFVKKSFVKDSARGIISGLFWDDYIVEDMVDDDHEKSQWFGVNDKQKASGKWMVYLWNKNGALNNDMDRPADTGVMSAELKRKIISNLRFASIDNSKNPDATPWIENSKEWPNAKLHLFSSDQNEILKLNTGDESLSNIYKGNIDTLLMPDMTDGMYLSLKYETSSTSIDISTITSETWNGSPDFISDIKWRLWGTEPKTEGSDHGLQKWNGTSWSRPSDASFVKDTGDTYLDLVAKKVSVRMKYKSTPHLVLVGEEDMTTISNSLPIVEIQRTIDPNTIFGGKSEDAKKQNIWIPCGEPVRLDDTTKRDEDGNLIIEYSWGDTYYQRWDCLKTYAFTPEDINQVVEIGSFMLETYVNIDGRYDRNRGQLSNLYMSPQNFNLINPVYSQLNNFFTYRIQDDDAYNEKKFPNQITWSKTKTSGADVDLWTNVTLASVLEMDGDKGSVRKLVRLNDQLLCFQDKGISQVLYNENVQINSTDGVPIEIANSGKVQGKRYLSDSVGCSNKWSMAQTPSGIYFMDSINKAIFMFNGQLSNLSGSLGFNSWAKENIPMCNPDDPEWTPEFPVYNSKSSFVSYYDKQNQDILFINNDTALAYSEKLGVFTSFYDYGNSAYFCNLQDTGIWIRNPYKEIVNGEEITHPAALWKHNAGEYCNFFGANHLYSMTLVGNPEPQMDKIFTNLEFRACVDEDGTVSDNRFTPFLPFDSLETWNEYQHGITTLSNKNGHAAFKHHTSDSDSSLKRKFRIWRCDIPRDNVNIITTQPTLPDNPTKEERAEYNAAVIKYNQYLDDISMGISRYLAHPNDRMRNTWLYLKLKSSGSIHRTEMHDVVMTYFN